MIRFRKNNVMIVLVCAVAAAGCYTKLMTPQEFVQTQRYQSKKTFADNSYSINYNQSCVSCHSTNELNERYDELSQMGITSVHNGIPLNPAQWENTTVAQSPIILVPVSDPFWPGPTAPVNPWWAPPVSTFGTSGTPAGENGNKIRDNGPSREGNRNGDRSIPISSPTYSQPPSSGSGTTTVSAPPPSSTNIAPAPQPVQTNTNERSRDSNSSSGSTNRTRDNGASRDDGGERPR